MVALQVVVSKGSELGWTSLISLILTFLVVLSGIAFFRIEKGKETAFIDFKLFKNSTYTGATISNFLLNGTRPIPEALFFDSSQFQTFITPLSFDGIEATTVIGDTIYFCVETKVLDSPCYVLRGTINRNLQIHLDEKVLYRLPKPINNAGELLTTEINYGFESLVHLKE
ncbi:MAG: hypothetical protein EOO93_16220 [Pedobacter sp.]|nr:MAG: hypothetical protein EOO93_16220 [Pedobacter sp.]